MEVQGVRYCQECGREILDDYGFCTACGWTYRAEPRSVSGSANVRTEQQPVPSQEETARIAYQAMHEAFYQQMMESNRKVTVFMLEIWIGMVIFMLSGLFAGSGPMFDSVKSIFGVGSDPMYETLIVGVSGSFALVSAVLCSVKRHWSLALSTCLISAIVTVALVFFNDMICIYFFFCGIITAIRVRNIRGAFSS